MKKRFAIFDMDGTLVDSMGYWDRVFGEYLENQGISGDIQELLLRTKTMSVLDGAVAVAQQFHLKQMPESIAEEFNAIMEHHYRDDVKLKPGVLEFLRSLKAQGVKMCVASTTCQSLIESCLEWKGIRNLFEFCLSSEQIGVGKERPDVYLEAARRLGAEPEAIAVFEDAPRAIETARKAGFYVVGIWDTGEESNWPTVQNLADETIIFS